MRTSPISFLFLLILSFSFSSSIARKQFAISQYRSSPSDHHHVPLMRQPQLQRHEPADHQEVVSNHVGNTAPSITIDNFDQNSIENPERWLLAHVDYIPATTHPPTEP